MLDNPHVRSQRIATTIAKDGTITTTLVIETNAESHGSDFDELVETVVIYIKAHDELDRAEINSRKTSS
jgi:hypothetical protein